MEACGRSKPVCVARSGRYFADDQGAALPSKRAIASTREQAFVAAGRGTCFPLNSVVSANRWGRPLLGEASAIASIWRRAALVVTAPGPSASRPGYVAPQDHTGIGYEAPVDRYQGGGPVGIRELQRDLDRAYANEARIGEKVDDLDTQIKVARADDKHAGRRRSRAQAQMGARRASSGEKRQRGNTQRDADDSLLTARSVCEPCAAADHRLGPGLSFPTFSSSTMAIRSNRNSAALAHEDELPQFVGHLCDGHGCRDPRMARIQTDPLNALVRKPPHVCPSCWPARTSSLATGLRIAAVEQRRSLLGEGDCKPRAA